MFLACRLGPLRASFSLPQRLLASASHCVKGGDASIVDAVVGAGNLCKGQPVPGERIAVTEILFPMDPLGEVALLRLDVGSKARSP